MIWLLLCVLVAAALCYLHPRVWVKLDVKAFKQNGSKDSLLKTFHRQRLTWRGVVMLAIAFLAAIPLLFTRQWVAAVLVAAGVSIASAAYFFFYFNPALSVARGLDYIGRYHVSWNPRAAYFPDRLIWQVAEKRYPWPDELVPDFQHRKRVEFAANALQSLLVVVLLAGCIVGGLLIAAGIWVANA